MKQTGLLILLFLLCAVGGMAQKGNIVITGQVVNRQADAPRSLNINVCDFFSNNSRINVPIDADGRFRTSFDAPFGHTFGVAYRESFAAYAAPGDSLYITIDDSRLPDVDAITFTGRHSDFCRAYYQGQKYMYDLVLAQREALRNNKTLPLEQYMRLFTDAYRAVDDSVRRCGRAHGWSEHACKLVSLDKLYALANFAAEYRGQNPQERLAFFTQPVFRLDDPDNLNNLLMYGCHLSFYRNSLCEQDSIWTRLSKADDREAAMRRTMEIILSRPRSISRDVMLNFYLYVNKQVPLPEASVFVLPKMWQSLVKMREEYLQQDTAYICFDCGSDSLVYHNAERSVYEAVCTDDFFRYLRERHPGKAIYVDIYSVGCGACRDEWKHHTPELHRQLQDKDVVFVNLCLSSSREAWQKMVEGHEVEGENYWFGKELTNRFLDLTDIRGYPTYMLLDRNGRVLSCDAPRPSQRKELLQLLDRVFEEK